MPQDVHDAVWLRGIDIHSKDNQYQLHHAIVQKGNVMGLPDEERLKIHSPFNLLVIPASANTSHMNIPSRDRAYRILRRHYTKHQIHKWFNSIGFKDGPPFRLPED